MSDYIERKKVIDAIHEEFDDCVVWDESGERTADEVESIIDRVPSADVVQVVRCKDCKHYYFADNRIPQEQRYVCEISGEIWKPDSFCSYGEREE